MRDDPPVHLDPSLPHAPYIAAVLAELGDLVGPDTHTQYSDMGHDADGDDVVWMEAFVDLGGREPDTKERMALLWRQTDGWRTCDYDGRGSVDCISPLLTGPTPPALPTPATVAAAARRLAGLWDARVMAADTEPAGGPLPDALQEAADCGDLTEPMALRLAAYCIQSSTP